MAIERRRWAVEIGAVVVACTMAAAPDARAAGSGEFVIGFGTKAPGTTAAMTFDVVYRDAGDPGAKPPAIAGAVFRLPAGTRIDTAAAPRCAASDDELKTAGTAACPADTRIGAGTLKAITGFGPPADPVAGEVTVFNGTEELIEVVTAPGTDRVLGIDRLHVEGNTLTANPPATPGGPPDGSTAIAEVHLALDRISGLVTTPWRCPASGAWTYSAQFRFADGSSGSDNRTVACERPTLALSMSPRRVVAGAVTTFQLRVGSQSVGCVRRARIGFAGRRLRVDDRGRASVRVALAAPGKRSVRVAAAGCRGASASVRVTGSG